MILRYKWFLMLAALMGTATIGLMVGKARESEYLASLYQRNDFTLLDDSGNFFSISSLPERSLALLFFTPDGIPVDMVKPVYEFSKRVGELKKIGIEPMMISRTNRDIVKNFKNATRFPERLLLDTGGTVGRNAGVWEGIMPVSYWGYALVDRHFKVLWIAREEVPMTMDKLLQTLKDSK